MEGTQRVCKKFTALEAELTCECKTIREPLDSSMDLHNHDGHEILLVLDGAINFYAESGGMLLERGDLICIHELEFHRAALLTKGLYDRIVINIRSGVLKRASSEQTDLESCFQKRAESPLNVVRLMEEEIAKIEEYAKALQESLRDGRCGDEILADAYLKLIMVMVNRHFEKKEFVQHREIMPELVMETFEYIEKHLTEEITLKKLEEYVHHNGTYLSRCFKKVAGISLQQFILAKKISLSCKLLQEGHPPIDVCYMTGFNNYSNFSRTFSKQVGMSPKKYQMQNR